MVCGAFKYVIYYQILMGLRELTPFLVLHFSYYKLITFLMFSVILLSMLMILLSNKFDQASVLWKQLELASELESDL